MSYKLHYFPIRGRGEQIRLFFRALWDVLDAILSNIESAKLDGFSHLQVFYDAFRAVPAVSAYIDSGERLS